MTLRKPVIICIVGESGTGKTYIADMLDKYYGIPMIESRTTRPRRTPDEVGHTWVTNKEYDTYREEDMIAHTKFGEHRYCCLIDDVLPGYNTYVIDEDGLKYLRENFSSRFNIFACRVFTPDYIRKEKIDEERMLRDEGRFLMGPCEFDYLLNNNHNQRTKYLVTKLVLRVQQKFNP